RKRLRASLRPRKARSQTPPHRSSLARARRHSAFHAEAYQVANALNVTRFPYASLIAHTPSVSSTAMSKIATSAGLVSSQDLISKFQTAINSHKEELDRLRAQRQEQQVNRSLRQEQESAYERSLAQDREKARKRKEEEAEKEKVEKEQREREERKADLARKLAQWRRWRAQSGSAKVPRRCRAGRALRFCGMLRSGQGRRGLGGERDPGACRLRARVQIQTCVANAAGGVIDEDEEEDSEEDM
ncbi:870_t:CDS:2, partial [Scutellospora calospora]